MLSFLPWFEVEKSRSVSEFVLVPYIRGETPFGRSHPDQGVVDSALEPYWLCRGRSVDKATLVQFAGKSLLAELDDDEIERSLQLANLMAFTGLASRAFFSMGGMTYANTEAFEMFIQRISPNGMSVAVSSRRRDGGSRNLITDDAFVVVKPEYVCSGMNLQLDFPLLEALLGGRQATEWSEIEEAIILFNLANSDRPQTRLATELVWTVSALERFFQLEHGKETQFRRAVVSGWPASARVALKDFERKPNNTGAPEWTVLDYWAADLFRCRNRAAHGRLGPSTDAVWSPQEHLLLSSHVFPLMIKLWLVKRDLYSLTQNDEDKIEVFETLLAHEDLFTPNGDGWPYHQILSSRSLDRIIEAASRDITSNPEVM